MTDEKVFLLTEVKEVGGKGGTKHFRTGSPIGIVVGEKNAVDLVHHINQNGKRNDVKAVELPSFTGIDGWKVFQHQKVLDITAEKLKGLSGVDRAALLEVLSKTATADKTVAAA